MMLHHSFKFNMFKNKLRIFFSPNCFPYWTPKFCPGHQTLFWLLTWNICFLYCWSQKIRYFGIWKPVVLFILFYFFFICSEFCHTLKWNSRGFTCVPHPDPPTHHPHHPLPLGLPSAPGLSACLMHPTWAGDLFHHR